MVIVPVAARLALPLAARLQRLDHFLRHVVLVVLGQHRRSPRTSPCGVRLPSATTPCPSRNRSGRMPTYCAGSRSAPSVTTKSLVSPVLAPRCLLDQPAEPDRRARRDRARLHLGRRIEEDDLVAQRERGSASPPARAPRRARRSPRAASACGSSGTPLSSAVRGEHIEFASAPPHRDKPRPPHHRPAAPRPSRPAPAASAPAASIPRSCRPRSSAAHRAPRPCRGSAPHRPQAQCRPRAPPPPRPVPFAPSRATVVAILPSAISSSHFAFAAAKSPARVASPAR